MYIYCTTFFSGGETHVKAFEAAMDVGPLARDVRNPEKQKCRKWRYRVPVVGLWPGDKRNNLEFKRHKVFNS